MFPPHTGYGDSGFAVPQITNPAQSQQRVLCAADVQLRQDRLNMGFDGVLM